MINLMGDGKVGVANLANKTDLIWQFARPTLLILFLLKTDDGA